MIFRLFNGADTKEAWNPDSPEFIDDWKPKELRIECDTVQVTYRDHIHVYKDDCLLEFHWDEDGYLEHEGVYYGDFIIGTGE